MDELYDLRQDPGEMNNLAGRLEMRGVEETLALRLLTHLEKSEDSLPAGKLGAALKSAGGRKRAGK